MSNVVYIGRNDRDVAYEHRLECMSREELLSEMVDFQQWRTREGKLSLAMMIRGIPLFKRLESVAETTALQSLTRAYRRHLELELSSHYEQR